MSPRGINVPRTSYVVIDVNKSSNVKFDVILAEYRVFCHVV